MTSNVLTSRFGRHNQTSLHSPLVTAFSQRLIPREGFGPGFKLVLEDFEGRTSHISLRDSSLLIDGEEVFCRAGSFESMSVAEVVIGDRLATLVGPNGFLQEPMTSTSYPDPGDYRD